MGSESRTTGRALLSALERFAEAGTIAEAADALLEADDLSRSERGWLELARGTALHRMDRAEPALSALHAALSGARETGEAELAIRCHAGLASLYAWRGHFDAALAHVSEALADAALSASPARLARLFGECGRIYLEAGQAGHAESFFERQRRLMDATDGDGQIRNRLGLIDCALEAGAPARAAALLAELSALPEPGTAYLALLVARAEARVHLASRRAEEAGAIAERALARHQPDPQSHEALLLQSLVAVADLDTGRPAALSALERIAGLFHQRRLLSPAIALDLLRAEALAPDAAAASALGRALGAAVASGAPALERKVREAMARLLPASAPGSDAADPAAMLAPDGFLLVERLGQGGFATVFRAFDLIRGREVALKRFRLADRYDHRARAAMMATARAELEATASLAHPGVARVVAFGTGSDGLAYVAQDFIAGDSLAARLAAGPIPTAAALLLLARIARVLAAVHAAGLVHRDLKPGNILCRPDDSPVLVDFGLAALTAGPQHSRPALAGGTADYMAPEQAEGAPAGSAADCHALGVIAVELLTGRRPAPAKDSGFRLWPFERADRLDVAQRDALAGAGLPSALADLLEALLAADPARRPSAEETATAFLSARTHLAPRPDTRDLLP